MDVERRGSALWLWINRPKYSNSLSPDVLDGLSAGLDQAEADGAIRSVVVAARGSVFCAGADLKHIRAIVSEPVEHLGRSAFTSYLRHAGRTFQRLEAFPKPVVAAVQGLVVAGGLELILCCDVVFAADAARIGDGHSVFGLIPGGGGSVRLTRRVGVSRAKFLMFSGETYPAAKLTNTDLVTEVVPSDRLEQAVDQFTSLLARRSPTGLRRMKYLADVACDVTQEAGLQMELAESAAHEKTIDFHEGIAAFLEGRAPVFDDLIAGHGQEPSNA